MAKTETSTLNDNNTSITNSSLIKILIIDDNRIIRHLLRLTFSDQSRFGIEEAEDSDQAFKMVKDFRPDIVILDIMLPGSYDGIDLCRLIKFSSDLEKTKVILLSARGQQEDLETGRKAGADMYITKPFSPQNLLNSVETLLRKL